MDVFPTFWLFSTRDTISLFKENYFGWKAFIARYRHFKAGVQVLNVREMKYISP